MRGLIVGRTGKIDSDKSLTPTLNITGVKKHEIQQSSLSCGLAVFRNGTIYLK